MLSGSGASKTKLPITYSDDEIMNGEGRRSIDRAALLGFGGNPCVNAASRRYLISFHVTFPQPSS